LDQVGGKIGNNNNTIYCDQDMGGLSSNNAASQAITLQLANCTTLYSPLLTAYDPAANSDYIPFEQNGEIITGFYEYTRGYLEHSANDTLANVDKVYVKNVAMASVGAAQHFAVAQSTLATSESSLADDQFQIYPIPTQNVLNIDFVEVGNAQFIFDLIDASGRLVMTSQNQKQIDVTALDTGIYIGRLKIKDKIFQKKIIIKK
jgi:aminopeptidase YwaD